ncbi:MAG: phage portal protein [Sedimentisphaerales bacterium]|nr:phage portal protein [Sedimentisphaerales bacterium]
MSNALVHTEIAAPLDSTLSSKAVSRRAPRRRIIRAGYDAAQTTDDNSRHWANADLLSADAALVPAVRSILRSRARYEVANNSYARGIINTLSNDTIGTGPRLQLLTPASKAANNTNKNIEAVFAAWAKEIRLAQKLRTMRVSKAVDGEAFGMLVSNKNLKSPVKLDLVLVEADRVTTPWKKGLVQTQKPVVDGIEYDRYGNPKTYYVLDVHPGNAGVGFHSSGGVFNKYTEVPASSMIHWFRVDRPGQHRGVPEITSALPLFAQLRRYTLAVIAAAESAADFAMVIYTDTPANAEAADVDSMDTVELERRMATTLPEGWKLGQTKAEQPATTYPEFKKELLNEIARCLGMPYNIAACNSAGYNYSSGRLDHQTYFKATGVERNDCELVVVDRVLDAWLDEAVLVSDLLPLSWRTNRAILHTWFWDGYEHIDPAKEAVAQKTRLLNNTTTLSREFAVQGLDWEVELEQRAREVKMLKTLGITPEPTKPEPEKKTAGVTK